MFRKIERDNDGSFRHYRVVGHLDHIFDTKMADLDIWTMPDASVTKDIDQKTRHQVLRCIAAQFCEIAREEEEVLKMYKKDQEKDHPVVAWKRAIFKTREMCDVSKIL